MDHSDDQSWKPGGVITATLTPMNEDLSVNSGLLAAHCRWLLRNGSDGIALGGTTGEANALSVAEKMIALDDVVEAGIPAHRLIVGTGSCAFPDTVALTRHAIEHGAGGVLMLPPFYYKEVSDDGLFASFDTVIQRVGDDKLRIYLYHFPRMSAVPLSLSLIERLLKHYPDQVAGVKDSSGDWDNMRVMAEVFPSFSVFAGTEAFLLDMLRAGGAGCISATANVTCVLAANVYRMWRQDMADDLQEHLTSIRLALQARSFIPALKGLMERLTGNRAWAALRPPHLPASAEESSALIETLKVLAFDFEHFKQVEA